MTVDEWHECDEMLRTHPALIAAPARRGITDPAENTARYQWRRCSPEACPRPGLLAIHLLSQRLAVFPFHLTGGAVAYNRHYVLTRFVVVQILRGKERPLRMPGV